MTLGQLLLLAVGHRREENDLIPPPSPPVYRRGISREDSVAGDVFSRLGAGQQDPAPGGSIRESNMRVSF